MSVRLGSCTAYQAGATDIRPGTGATCRSITDLGTEVLIEVILNFRFFAILLAGHRVGVADRAPVVRRLAARRCKGHR